MPSQKIKLEGELLEKAIEPEAASPLAPMHYFERIQADFANSGISIGAHPMRFHREQLDRQNVVTARQLLRIPNGRRIRVAGGVICRQQPSTAKGFVFLSLEDETGIANIILEPDVFKKLRTTILTNSYLLIEGILQNQRGVRTVRAEDAQPCHMPTTPAVPSHDFR